MEKELTYKTNEVSFKVRLPFILFYFSPFLVPICLPLSSTAAPSLPSLSLLLTPGKTKVR